MAAGVTWAVSKAARLDLRHMVGTLEWSFVTAMNVGQAAGETHSQKAPMIRITFEPEPDIAYVHFEGSVSKGAAIEQVVVERSGGDIVMDFGADGILLGIEVLGASNLLPAVILEGAGKEDYTLD